MKLTDEPGVQVVFGERVVGDAPIRPGPRCSTCGSNRRLLVYRRPDFYLCGHCYGEENEK